MVDPLFNVPSQARPLRVRVVEVSRQQALLEIPAREANQILQVLMKVDSFNHEACLRLGYLAGLGLPFDEEVLEAIAFARRQLPRLHEDRFSGIAFELTAGLRISENGLDRRRF